MTATGAARYVVPLSLPPGTNGLAPSLAIAYDSRGGNGLLGAGFRLAGFSTIQRCGSTLAQDGAARRGRHSTHRIASASTASGCA